MTTIPLSVFTDWLAFGERGISSEAIVSHLTGQELGQRIHRDRDFPHDPADFRRCELLLRRVELARLVFPEMCSRSPQWAALVGHWDEIADLMEAEAPGCFTPGARPGGSAPKAWARMQELTR